ncbi:helix-turn-helix domain-containing protein [Pectinatus frisingensis]|uniref:helix-turn-helix domain-containing protein n=1 Tax=Pectinatus frisingensis TaxID=865 RepID=UPI0018C79F05|nr:helix-turn-helix domain-containing protein [Pectinatus frisingensis]
MENLTANRLKQALSLRNMKQIELSERTHIGKSAISQYLSGKIVPKQDKIYLIAQVLDINEGWLMGYDVPMERETYQNNLHNNLPDLTKKDERQIQKKLKALLDDLDPAAGVAYYNDEEPISDEDKELLRISLENTLRLTKQLAKQKFTPKKYRKE